MSSRSAVTCGQPGFLKRALTAMLVTALLPTTQVHAQQATGFTVTPSTDATALAQRIVGSGVTLVGTPKLTGMPVQAGLFERFTTGQFVNPVTQASGAVTIAQGVILSSGVAQDAAKPFDGGGADTDLDGGGDTALGAISGFPTQDAVSLEFSFIPDAEEIFIEYLFASTEYPFYVNSAFNDVFGFFVNGVNAAFVPGTTDPVTINKVNGGNPPGTSPTNPQYFTQYSTPATPFNYGGATVLLTARARVNKGVVNTFRFAVADSSDGSLDSAVFIGTGKFTTAPPSAAPKFSTTALPNGQIGLPYSFTLSATGGTPPYTFSVVPPVQTFGVAKTAFSATPTAAVVAGELPPGLVLTPAGVIQGIPTEEGTFTFSIRVTDSANNSSVQSFTLTIVGPGPIITTQSLPAGSALIYYSTQLTAQGGSPPLRFSVSSGSLPPGFSLTEAGLLYGTAGGALSSSIGVTVTDVVGRSSTKNFVLAIAPQEQVSRSLEIGTSLLPEGVVGKLYAVTFFAKNGSGSVQWSFSGLPAGIQSNAAGELIGTPARSGSFPFQAAVSDDKGQRAVGSFTLVVRPAVIAILTEKAPDGRLGEPYNAGFVASGGLPPYSFAVSGGTLPPGLTLANNGALSGTPTTVGTFVYTIQATDGSGEKGTRTYTSIIRPPLLVITTANLGAPVIGRLYSLVLEATGGVRPYSWSATGLPDGLSLNQATGAISGTPTRTGVFNVSVGVTDRENESAAKSFRVTVITEVVITSVLGNLVVGSPLNVQLSASGGRAPYSWSVASGSLPSGLSLTGDGVLSGTPSTIGDFNFGLQARDADNVIGTRSFVVRVISPLIITTESIEPARFATAYSSSLAASGGTPPYTWSVVRGELPAGLSLSGTGSITGTTTAAGTFTFTAQVSDAGTPAQTAQRAFTLSVQLPDVPGLSITIPANPQAGQQAPISLAIPSPYPVDISGTLNLTFVPNAANNADDPAIQFSTGGRSVPFTIAAGQTQAVFRVADLAVQTGTTAGTITLAALLQAGGGPVNCNCQLNQTIVIPRSAPVISSVRVTRTAGGFNVLITGFSTSREVTQGLFRFAGSTTLQTTELTVALTPTFNTYYQGAASAGFGGQFALTIPFTIQGDTTTVNSVTATLTNGTGTSQAVTSTF